MGGDAVGADPPIPVDTGRAWTPDATGGTLGSVTIGTLRSRGSATELVDESADFVEVAGVPVVVNPRDGERVLRQELSTV
jgi:hypothetical protein